MLRRSRPSSDIRVILIHDSSTLSSINTSIPGFEAGFFAAHRP
jgi:hypothetical protein